jgi:hypothetical protein
MVKVNTEVVMNNKKFHFIFFQLFLIISFFGCGKQSAETDKQNEKSPGKSNNNIIPEKTPDKINKNIEAKTFNKNTNKVIISGISECDKYSKLACSLYSKHPTDIFYKGACEQAKKTLPTWKNSLKDESQRDSVIKACRNAIAYLKSTPKYENEKLNK